MRSMVEGRAPLDNQPRNSVEVLHDLGSGKAERDDAQLEQLFIPLRIACWSIPHVMRDTVNLDREPRLRAIKVEHIVANGMLAPKAQTSGASPQILPHLHFGRGHRATQCSGFDHG